MDSITTPNHQVFDQPNAIALWLVTVVFFIFCVIIVGGITRLTRSGLSIVEWRPVTGIIPPLNNESWLKEFEKYKKFPEYKARGSEMSLSDFKYIYFWEYLHRLLGRLIGFIFIGPFIYFLIRGKLHGALLRKTTFAFLLGALQGLLGWYMVKSGLVNIPRVSHYRLAAHLLLAILILEYLFWLFLDLFSSKKTEQPDSIENQKQLKLFLSIITVVLVLQIIYGAFTAGLRAGYIYNTFPKMGTEWVPDAIYSMTPFWNNFLENSAMVQFIHRLLGWALLFAIILFRILSSKYYHNFRQKLGSNLLLMAIVLQFLLGVLTLIYAVPVSLAVIHQGCAVVLLTISVFSIHSLLEMES